MLDSGYLRFKGVWIEMKKLRLLLASIVFLVSSCQNDGLALWRKHINVVIVGDSTVATYDKASDKRGWGQLMQPRFKGNVTVYNLARNGRSSKSFIDEGLWAKALEKKPDYVFIQFGHNDCPGKGPKRHTDPNTTYKYYLRKYISDTRQQGGEPIIVTSMERRKYGPDGKVKDSLGAYAQAAREVAAEQKVFLIDLHTESVELFNSKGEEATNYMNCSEDRTHWNPAGAQIWSNKIVSRLREAKGPYIPLVNSLR
jgi:lysophospholipase L1-like esterase